MVPLSLLSLYRIPSLIPYFIETQRTSFLNFLQIGLPFQLKTRFVSEDQNIFIYQPDTSKSHSEIDWYKIKIQFYPEYYLLSRPKYTPKSALVKFKDYNSKLYIPILYKKGLKLPQYQWVILNELPLMTSNGHFILRGVSRVVVNQIIRSPGIYYTSETDKKQRTKYSAQLISRRGTWLEFEVDKQKRLWVKMMKKPKIPAAILLQALGFDCSRGCCKLLQYIRYAVEIGAGHQEIMRRAMTSKKFVDYRIPSTTDESLRWIYYFLSTRETKFNWKPNMKGYFQEIMKCQRFLVRKFFSSRTYDLGSFGRTQLNKKFGLSISNTFRVLTPKDILAALNYLFGFRYGNMRQDDIDHLKNRRVRTSGELVEDRFRTGFSQAISKFFTQTNEEWVQNQKGSGWPKKKSKQPINPKPPATRGRPRKTEVQPVNAKPPAKRGRPRKVEIQPIHAKPPVKRGRPRKNEPTPVQPKRKPGRPPKLKTESELVQPKRKPGRPPKLKTESELVQPKRKPGRPPKPKDESEPVQPKRKPGRPPKPKDESEPRKEKRKRGRPPKNQAKPEQDK